MAKTLTLSLFIFIFSYSANAQLIDVIQGHIGTAIFPQAVTIDYEKGKPDNIYSAYSAAQILGLGASKFLTDKIQVVAAIDFMNVSKPHYSLVTQKTSLNLKYNFIAPDVYRFSPYIIGGGSISSIFLSQEDFNDTLQIPEGESGAAGKFIPVTKKIIYENEYSFSDPFVFGANIGLGLDVNIFEVFSIFGEINYNHIFVKNSSLQNETTSYNKFNLVYTNLTAGVRIYMY